MSTEVNTWQPPHGEPSVVNVSAGMPVTIQKEFGPLIFWPVRVTADLDSGDWIVERLHGPVGEWREAARIPGQVEADFTDGY